MFQDLVHETRDTTQFAGQYMGWLEKSDEEFRAMHPLRTDEEMVQMYARQSVTSSFRLYVMIGLNVSNNGGKDN